MSPPTFQRGDVVKYSRTFLRNVGWYTNVPRDGLVLGPADLPGCVVVVWCDDPEGPGIPVRTTNLIHHRTLEPA